MVEFRGGILATVFNNFSFPEKKKGTREKTTRRNGDATKRRRDSGRGCKRTVDGGRFGVARL